MIRDVAGEILGAAGCAIFAVGATRLAWENWTLRRHCAMCFVRIQIDAKDKNAAEHFCGRCELARREARVICSRPRPRRMAS